MSYYSRAVTCLRRLLHIEPPQMKEAHITWTYFLGGDGGVVMAYDRSDNKPITSVSWGAGFKHTSRTEAIDTIEDFLAGRGYTIVYSTSAR